MSATVATCNGASGLTLAPPADEPPRERLLARGAEALTDAELLAVLLRAGGPAAQATELAHDLLAGREGLPGLVGLDRHALHSLGLTEAKAAVLLAALELAARLARTEIASRTPMDRSHRVANYIALRYGTVDHEVMGALFLDVRHRLIDDCELYRGTVSRLAIEPRAILKTALLRSASSFVLFHTHPSGDPSPSALDLTFTRRMSRAARVVGVRLVDHLIVANGGRWVSLRERGIC